MSLFKCGFNERLTERIRENIIEGRILHAYILEGDSLSGKEKFAKEFCKAIMCKQEMGVGCDRCASCRKIEHGNYEDLYVVEAEGMSVKDEQVAKLQEELRKKPLGERNLAIIKDADTMTPRAQNRLLKTLEEPFEGTVMLLLSENRENLLDTVKSRCVLYHMEDSAENAEGKEMAESIFEAVCEEKPFFEIKQILSGCMKNREDAFVLLDGMERIYGNLLTDRDPRGRMLKKEEIIRVIELIEEARRDLNAKVNYQYAVKNLIIKIGGLEW